MRHARPRPGRHARPKPTGRRWSRPVTVLAVAACGPLAVGLPAAAALAATSRDTPVGSCAPVAEGAFGAAVASLQSAVGATPDGDFGPLTRAAVVAYQHRHGLPATGVVDAATWRSLPAWVTLSACGAPVRGLTSSWCPTLAQGSVGTAVMVLQRAVGTTVDGIFGPHTAAAVAAAQRRLRLPATAASTPSLWAELHLAGSPACTPGGTATPIASRTATTASAPSHAAAQAAVRAQVLRLAAGLESRPTPATPVLAAPAIAFGLAQRGKPYVWGGTGPAGYDCSGLVQASYRAAGITLPRTAAEQYGAGRPVPLNQLAPGDLVFFASDLTNPATIYHVALYLGRGVVLNAPRTGERVRTEPLFTAGLLPTGVRPTAELTLPLRIGNLGWSVQQLQRELTAAGVAVTVDGDFGPLTQAAVRSFQSSAHLSVDGVVGPDTWHALVAAAS